MKATVEYRANPFAPAEARVVTVRSRRRLSRLAPKGRAPVIALVNGVPVLRANSGWQRRRLADGDRVVFATLPCGGGRGGSNPLRIFLQIALIAVAGPLAGGVAAAFGITAGAAQAGIMLAGAALLNAALPVPQPGGPPQASPTYTLSAQGNSARVGAPIPVQYGRVLAYPDFAATPYAEFAGEEQYLYQLLCLGAGEYDVEEIRIEDTPIASFAEIETQVVPPGGQVTLFPTQVATSVEVAGQELPKRFAATWSRSGTTVTVTKTAHGRASGQAVAVDFTTGGGPDGTYAIATVPDADTFTLTTAATGTSGDCTVDTLVGGANGFVASAAGLVAHRLGIDLVFPQGLYRVDGDGDLVSVTVTVEIEARRIDDAGAPLGGWTTLLTQTVTAKTATPVRRSWAVALSTPGRWQVRAKRTNEGGGSSRYDQVIWAGLRAYLAEDQDFGPVTLVALRMRATNNLSLQASRRVGVIATRKLPVWNGTSWSAPVATRSIAWALADAARDTGYGAGRADAKVDLAALLALDAVWAARGDTFSFRFDQGGTWWDAVQKIAAAGRARAYMQGGILRIARDAPQAVPVALYSMRNIVQGSFRIDYALPQPDASPALDVHYFDSATWAPQRERIALFGGGSGQPARLALDGVDNRPQALREGRYHAAAARYRRRVAMFETEMEGFIPSVLDLIAIQHDMPGWGAQAEVRAWNAATRTLTLTEPVDAGPQTVVALRRPDGSPWGPVAVMQGATPQELVLASVPDFTPVTAQDRERTHAAIGTSQTWAMTARVLHVRPRGLHRVAIEAVAEDPAVHAAELGVALPPRRASDLPRRFTQPVVAALFARPVPGDATMATIGWRPAPGADTYHVEMAEGLDPLDPEAAWTRVADTSAASRMVVLLHARRTMIRVRGMGLAAGPWEAGTIGSLIPDYWNPDAATSMWSTDGALMWSS